MDNPAAIYHVARDGQVIGAFTFPALAAKFKDGSVKASDHYLVEGTSDWKLVGELKPQFAEHERQLKAEADRKAANLAQAKYQERKEAVKSRALESEADRLRRELAASEAARKRADSRKPKQWKCHTCQGNFESTDEAKPYPSPSGSLESFWFMALSWVCAGIGTYALRPVEIVGFLILCVACIFAIVSLTHAISAGTERGLQQFNSYRPRCPNCSSPYCSK